MRTNSQVGLITSGNPIDTEVKSLLKTLADLLVKKNLVLIAQDEKIGLQALIYYEYVLKSGGPHAVGVSQFQKKRNKLSDYSHVHIKESTPEGVSERIILSSNLLIILGGEVLSRVDMLLIEQKIHSDKTFRVFIQGTDFDKKLSLLIDVHQMNIRRITSLDTVIEFIKKHG